MELMYCGLGGAPPPGEWPLFLHYKVQNGKAHDLTPVHHNIIPALPYDVFCFTNKKNSNLQDTTNINT